MKICVCVCRFMPSVMGHDYEDWVRPSQLLSTTIIKPSCPDDMVSRAIMVQHPKLLKNQAVWPQIALGDEKCKSILRTFSFRRTSSYVWWCYQYENYHTTSLTYCSNNSNTHSIMRNTTHSPVRNTQDMQNSPDHESDTPKTQNKQSYEDGTR
jgi:hypothetical protein